MARQSLISTFGKFRPTSAGGGEINVLNKLAGLSQQVGDIAFQMGAKQAEKEGRLAGLQSVEREGGQVKPLKMEDPGLSIRQQAFNDAAILAHRAAIKTDSKNRLDELQRDEALDPEKFELRARAYKDGLLTDMPEELAVLVGSDIDSSIVSRKSKLDNDFFKRIEAENIATLNEGLETFTDDILNSVREGDLARVEKLTIESNAMIDQAVDSAILNPSKAEAIKEDLRERVIHQDTLGQVERALTDEPTIDTVKTADDVLKKIKKQKFKDLKPPQKDAMIRNAEIMINGAMSDIARNQSKEKAKLNGEIKELNAEKNRAITNLNAGVNVNSQELSNMAARGEAINKLTGENTIDVAELQREITEQQEVNTFSAQPTAVRQAQESQLIGLERAGKLSNEQAEILRRIRKANNQVNIQLDKKGIEYYQEQGLGDIGEIRLIDEQGDFDFAGFVDSMESRKTATLRASAHYAKDLSPFTNFEAEQLMRVYAAQDSQGKASLLGAIVEGFEEMAMPALSQMNDKGAGVMALSGAILNDGGDPTLILQGQELLKEPANRNLLPTGGEAVASFEREITSQLGSAFALNASQRGATVQAVKAAYAAISAQEGITDELVDSDRLRQAINVATGGIVEHNDFNVSAPIRGMDQGDFEEVIGNLTPEVFDFSFQELPEIDRELLVEQIQDNATFHDVGPGQYLVKIGDGFLVDANGDEYILELRKAIEGLQ